jgi:hypothetical protein
MRQLSEIILLSHFGTARWVIVTGWVLRYRVAVSFRSVDLPREMLWGGCLQVRGDILQVWAEWFTRLRGKCDNTKGSRHHFYLEFPDAGLHDCTSLPWNVDRSAPGYMHCGS